jgi:hypothetical protein
MVAPQEDSVGLRHTRPSPTQSEAGDGGGVDSVTAAFVFGLDHWRHGRERDSQPWALRGGRNQSCLPFQEGRSFEPDAGVWLLVRCTPRLPDSQKFPFPPASRCDEQAFFDSAHESRVVKLASAPVAAGVRGA